jgi:t-SNARE complex subunit (syntaxin)
MEAMEEGDIPMEEVYDVGFNDRQKMEVDHSIKDIQHRNTEIKNIQKSIMELAEVVKEMAILVVDQVMHKKEIKTGSE